MNALAAGIAVALGASSPGFGLWVAVVAALAPFVGKRIGDLWWGPVTALIALAAGLAVANGAPVENALLGVLAWLLVHRGLVSTGPDRVSSLIVALLLVAASTRSNHVGFLIAVVAWIADLPWSLGGATGRTRWTLAAVIGGLALPLFWALPRFAGATGPLDTGRGLTGFADDVELGAMNTLLDDPALVFRARFSTLPDEPPYFRGVALDRFDGRRWTSTAARQREQDWTDPLPDLVRVQVELEAHPEGVLFVPGVVEGIDASGVAVERDEAGAYHLPGPARAVGYTVFTNAPWGPGRGDPFRDAAPSVALPELSAEARELFESHVTDATGPDARIEALVTWLRTDFAYTRQPRDTDTEAPLEDFLLREREGHCEYFASALAVGGRVVGVPTRVVNGFVGGEGGGPDEIVFRRYHAHSWVEYFDGDRWVTADATPRIGAPEGPGLSTRVLESVERLWEESIVDFDADTQLGTARAVADTLVPFAPDAGRDWIGVVLVGLFAGVVLLAARLAVLRGVKAWGAVDPREARDPVTAELERAWRAVERSGLELPSGPDVEVARWVKVREPEVGARLEELAWLSYEVRFGRGDASSRVARAAQLGRAVRAAVDSRPSAG
ncbi:MAG: DUF3488 and transglutaminase-like domain-containing protein [Myxococcota bacterium]